MSKYNELKDVLSNLEEVEGYDWTGKHKMEGWEFKGEEQTCLPCWSEESPNYLLILLMTKIGKKVKEQKYISYDWIIVRKVILLQMIPAFTRASLPKNQNHQIFTFGNVLSTFYLYILFHDGKYCSRFNLFIAPKFCVKNYLMTRHWIVFKKIKQT